MARIKSTTLSRRDFLAGGTSVAAASLFDFSNDADAAGKAPEKSKVVLVRNRDVLGENDQLDPTIFHNMLNDGVKNLVNENDVSDAWQKLISASDVVGIKSNFGGV